MLLRTNVKLFHKEPDIQCWNCNKLISHKSVKWKPRQLPLDNIAEESELPAETVKLARKGMEKLFGKPILSSPNKIFGSVEYEYRGKCSECNAELSLFWFGDDSIKRNNNRVNAQTLLKCTNCKTAFWRITQVWYSITIQKDGTKTEYLVNLCPKCKTQLVYPYKYDLELGIIE